MPRKEKFQDVMFMAAQDARSLPRYWDTFTEEERKEMAMRICEGFSVLMDLRNLIHGVSALEAPISEAAEPYLGG